MTRRKHSNYSKDALEYVCIKCNESKKREEFTPSFLCHSHYVCRVCHNQITRLNKIKQNERKNDRLEGLFADFWNNIPSEKVIKKQQQDYLEKRQNIVKVRKPRTNGGITIRLPKELTSEINKYMDSHGGYISVTDFIRETIRLRLFNGR